MAFSAWDSLRGPFLLYGTVTAMLCLPCFNNVVGTLPTLQPGYNPPVTSGLQKLGSRPESWMHKGKPLRQRGRVGLTPCSP